MKALRDKLKGGLGQTSKWLLLALVPLLVPLFAIMFSWGLALITIPVLLLLPPLSDLTVKWIYGITLAVSLILSIASVVWMYRHSA